MTPSVRARALPRIEPLEDRSLMTAMAIEPIVPLAAPVANDNNAGMFRNGVLLIDPRGNDSDADGDPLSYAGFTPAVYGTVTLLSTGVFQYVPYTGFVGSDQFTYNVTDGVSVATATVRINVQPNNGAVRALIVGGRLEIQGDELDSAIRVELGGSGKNTARITGLNGTLINGASAPAEFALISKGVRMLMLGGADEVELVGSGLKAGVTIEGGEGDDRYKLATQKTKVNVKDSGGKDWLDFRDASAGIILNVGMTRGQSQEIGDGNRLTLRGVIEHVFGTASADRITGNAEHNILIGGDGNDVLLASGGRDFMIGGTGLDRLSGSAAGNVLIGSQTVYDGDVTALNQLLAEWTSSHSFVTRSQNLQQGNGSPDLLNGSFRLQMGVTIGADGEADQLLGVVDPDLLFD